MAVMTATDSPKKAAQGRPSRNDPPGADWHPADIKSAVEKAGWSLRGLCAHHGYATGWIQRALYEPSPVAEGIIAKAIKLHPKQIWPSRYDNAGRPKARIKRGRVVPENIPPRRLRHDLRAEVA